MLSSRDVAEYFIFRAKYVRATDFSHLKIQKLVYYAQGHFLAMFGKPLFGEPIQAWDHGPVVESLYHSYKRYRDKPIPLAENFQRDSYKPIEETLLNEVCIAYGGFSAIQLRNMSHRKNTPWHSTCSNRVIKEELMQEFFRHNPLHEHPRYSRKAEDVINSIFRMDNGERIGPEHRYAWLKAFDQDEMTEFLRELLDAKINDALGSSNEVDDLDDVDVVIHEWYESALAILSEDVDTAWADDPDEVPLTAI